MTVKELIHILSYLNETDKVLAEVQGNTRSVADVVITSDGVKLETTRY